MSEHEDGTRKRAPRLGHRHISAGTDLASGLPAIRLDNLKSLGLDMPDQTYILTPEAGRLVGARLMAASLEPARLHDALMGTAPDSSSTANIAQRQRPEIDVTMRGELVERIIAKAKREDRFVLDVFESLLERALAEEVTP